MTTDEIIAELKLAQEKIDEADLIEAWIFVQNCINALLREKKQ